MYESEMDVPVCLEDCFNFLFLHAEVACFAPLLLHLGSWFPMLFHTAERRGMGGTASVTSTSCCIAKGGETAQLLGRQDLIATQKSRDVKVRDIQGWMQLFASFQSKPRDLWILTRSEDG